MIDKENNNLSIVSIIIACYNHEQFVKESIQSVIDQDYKNIELIIIDDGSSDGSVKVIEEMIRKCELRFTRFEFRHRANKGLCFTLNEALEWCKGEFISGVASDDTLKKYKTSVQVDYLIKNPESIGVFGGVEVFYEDTGVRKTHVTAAGKYSFNDIFLHKHNLPASTSLLRIEPVRSLGGYKEAFLIEDWSLWLFLTERGGTLDYINMVFGTYRMHQSNVSLQLDRMRQGRIEVVNLFRDHCLYKKALAKVNFITAIELQTVSYKKSFRYIFRAVVLDFSIVCDFSKYYIRMLVSKIKRH